MRRPGRDGCAGDPSAGRNTAASAHIGDVTGQQKSPPPPPGNGAGLHRRRTHKECPEQQERGSPNGYLEADGDGVAEADAEADGVADGASGKVTSQPPSR